MRFYRLLLHLYPLSFRNEYGGEMCAIFARSWRHASGPLARAALVPGAILEVIGNAALVHWDILKQDLAYTFRIFRRAPGFAATAVAIVALGIGATTAAFSVTDFVLIRPLPFPDAGRLVKVWERRPGYARMELSPANFRDLKRAATSFESWGAYRGLAVNLGGASEPQHLEGAAVTADVFGVLGVKPALGRLFSETDDAEGSSGTLVLSYRLWQTEFGGDEHVIGRTVTLDDQRYTIIGVMPPSFYFPSRDATLWAPMRFAAREFEDRNDNYLASVAQQPVSSLRTLAEIVDGETAWRAVQVRVLALFACIAFVLSAVGIHGVLSFAVSQRAHEIGVRIALGASATDILRMVSGRGALLVVAGVIPGVVLAYGAGRAMQALLAGVAPADTPTFAAVIVLCVLMTVLGTLRPTLRALRVDPISTIRAE